MPSHAASGREFAAFDPPLARAVVAVLREEGLRAWTRENHDTEVRVFVDPADHEAALSCLGRRLPEVQERAAAERSGTAGPRLPPAGEPGESAGGDAPLVMERFRRAGVAIGVVLAPLLILTLAAVRLSRPAAVLILLAGVVAVLVLRLRHERG